MAEWDPQGTSDELSMYHLQWHCWYAAEYLNACPGFFSGLFSGLVLISRMNIFNILIIGITLNLDTLFSLAWRKGSRIPRH